MTYLTTWLTIVFGAGLYAVLVKRDLNDGFFDAAFWSAFALLMHGVAFG